MSSENRNYHQEIHELIENRPWAFGHLRPQRIYKGLAIFAAIASLLFALILTIKAAIKSISFASTLDQINEAQNLKLTENQKQKILEALLPDEALKIAIILLLTVMFFLIARYARKTIRRNQYILQLEDIIKSSRMYDVVNPPKTDAQNATPDANAL
jgi:hypothetical protein